jgi:hypothetical protein
MKKFVIFIITIMALATIFAEQIEKTFSIKYISAEHIYINGGRNDGLETGDTLKVLSDGRDIALIQVVFVADNSSSCDILSSQQAISLDDKVSIQLTAEAREEPVVPDDTGKTETVPQPSPEPSIPLKKSQPFASFHGRVAFQVYHYDDKNPANLDFTQPTMRINLETRDLGGKDIGFRLNMRSRQDSRTRSYNDEVAKNEWINKIYELSFSIGGDDSDYRFMAGRIIPRGISGVGFIDGVLLERSLTGSFTAGLFAGTLPQWQYAEFQTSLQKYGLFAGFRKGDLSILRLETSLALTAEYHSSTVSREFIYIRNYIGVKNKLRIYQSADIDINRDWRKDKTGSTLSLSNLYITAKYPVGRWFDASLSFDNRKNYFTYDTRTIDERIFDDNTRQGLRGNIYLKLPANFRLNGGAGVRNLNDQSKSAYSYNAGIRKSNITSQMFFVSANVVTFTTDYTDGLNFNARLGKYTRRGDQVAFSYGIYRYDYNSTASTRKSQWYGFNLNARIYRRYYLFTDYQYNSGDDLNGHKVLAEIGYRF